jgi:hypothetical protein
LANTPQGWVLLCVRARARARVVLEFELRAHTLSHSARFCDEFF